MKSSLISIALTFIFFSTAFAQSKEEKEQIIQQCIDLPDLDEYYKEEIKKGSAMVIEMNEVVPKDLELTRFGKPVQIMEKHELFFHAIRGLYFKQLELIENRGEVVFYCPNCRATFAVTFEKEGSTWTLKRRELLQNETH